MCPTETSKLMDPLATAYLFILQVATAIYIGMSPPLKHSDRFEVLGPWNVY